MRVGTKVGARVSAEVGTRATVGVKFILGLVSGHPGVSFGIRVTAGVRVGAGVRIKV